jgi:hypothetical protein
MIEKELKLDFYHTELLSEIPSAIFDFRAVLREALLIEVPKTIECRGGKCPERATIAPYLGSRNPGTWDTDSGPQVEKTTYFPFADLH